MDTIEMRLRIRTEMVARLATVGPQGRPHIVPITFAADDDALYFAIDQKPKKTADLLRLRNIAANPAVAVLIDHYEDDWTKLWWVRIDGIARIVAAGADLDLAMAHLSERYTQYRADRPRGPVVAIAIERMSGWSAS